MDRTPPSRPAVIPVGFILTAEELRVLQAIWRCDERVDWAGYEALKARVLAWPAGR